MPSLRPYTHCFLTVSGPLHALQVLQTNRHEPMPTAASLAAVVSPSCLVPCEDYSSQIGPKRLSFGQGKAHVTGGAAFTGSMKHTQHVQSQGGMTAHLHQENTAQQAERISPTLKLLCKAAGSSHSVISSFQKCLRAPLVEIAYAGITESFLY